MPVIVRDLKKEDIEKINDIFERNPYTDVPGLNYMIVNAVMEDKETRQIIGYGAVKVFVEAQMILDKELSKKRNLVEAFTEAMTTAITYSRDAGVDKLYVNSNDESFIHCLKNRFKFKEVTGQLLALELNAAFEDK